MYSVEIQEKEFVVFLSDKNIFHLDNLYYFHTKEQFASYFTDFFIQRTIEDFLENKMKLSFEQIKDLTFCLDENILKAIEQKIKQKILEIIKHKNSIRFDKNTYQFGLYPYKKELHKLLIGTFRDRGTLYKKTTSLPVNPETLYVVINEEVIEIRSKNTEKIIVFDAEKQEDVVAHLIYMNPKLLIVYDHKDLLKPELVLFLTDYFKRRVEFFEEKYPITGD